MKVKGNQVKVKEGQEQQVTLTNLELFSDKVEIVPPSVAEQAGVE